MSYHDALEAARAQIRDLETALHAARDVAAMERAAAQSARDSARTAWRTVFVGQTQTRKD